MFPHYWSRSVTALVRSLALVPLAIASNTAFGQGRIAGVTIATNGGSVSGTRVQVQGTTLFAISSGTGAYEIDNVPAGIHTIRTIRLGYQSAVVSVVVTNGATTTLNLVLSPATAEVTLVTADVPLAALPEDSLKFPVPDSAIIRRRQAEGLAFTLKPGQRGVLALFDDVNLTMLVSNATTVANGVDASGTLIAGDGSIEGSFVLVARGNTITANIRHGLRLYQIRHQLRGVHLVVEVDQKKLRSAPGDDAGETALITSAASGRR